MSLNADRRAFKGPFLSEVVTPSEDNTQIENISASISSYEYHLETFRNAWNEGLKQSKIAFSAMNEMVRDLNQSYPKWSINRILLKISNDNEDLEGFSLSNLKRELDSDNRKLIQKNSRSPERLFNYDNDVEQSYEDEDSEFENQLNQDVSTTQTIDLKDLHDRGRNTEQTIIDDFLNEKSDGSKRIYEIDFPVFKLSGLQKQLENMGVKVLPRFWYQKPD